MKEGQNTYNFFTKYEQDFFQQNAAARIFLYLITCVCMTSYHSNLETYHEAISNTLSAQYLHRSTQSELKYALK